MKELFTLTEERLLKDLMNIMIPPIDDLLGAGDLGLLDEIKDLFLKRPHYIKSIKKVIEALSLHPETRLSGGFFGMKDEKKINVIKEIENELSEDFKKLTQALFSVYYLDERIKSRIGWDIKSPQPKGFDLPPWNPKILDNVKKLKPFWKAV